MNAHDVLSQINELLISSGSNDRDTLTKIDDLVTEYFTQQREELGGIVMGNRTVYANLTSEEKEILIQLFYDLYFNLDQDSEEFGHEFFSVVGTILSGSIPLELEYLVDFEESMIDSVPRLETLFEGKEE